MKLLSIIALAAFVAMPIDVLADDAEVPRPWVTTSEHGDSIFKMTPPKWKEEGDRFVLERRPPLPQVPATWVALPQEVSRDHPPQQICRTDQGLRLGRR